MLKWIVAFAAARPLRSVALIWIFACAAVRAGDDDATPIRIEPNAPYDPQAPAAMTYGDANVDLKLTPWNGHRYRLLVKDRISAAELIDLPEELERIDFIRRVVGSKAVVFGATIGGAQEVVVLDWIQHKLLDKFWCYAPTLSPDGRYVAFIKFYPAHIVESTSDSQYRIYDLRQNTADNRLDADRSDFDLAMKAGTVMYPLKAGEVDRPETQVTDANAHHSAAFGADPAFFWAPDASMLAFGDTQGGAMSLVLVTLPGKTQATPNTRVFKLAGSDNIAAGSAAEDLGLTALAFDGAQIHATFVSQRDNRGTTRLTVRLDQFKAAAH